MERMLTLRRPPSVSSRTSGSRRHRSHRSNHGSSSHHLENNFPVFAHTGDVDINIVIEGREQRYLLHRLILAQCSGFFEAGTSEEWSRVGATGRELTRIGEDPGERNPRTAVETPVGGGWNDGNSRSSSCKVRWRYELDTGHNEGDARMLVQKNPSSTLFGGSAPPRLPIQNKPITGQTGFFRSMANLSSLHPPSARSPVDATADTLRDYDNLFRIFYNYPPLLDPVNIAAAYVECKSLINLADMYDAVEVVGPRIDHHLLQFQGRLWKQIAKYPPSYLKLGFMARSRAIYAEAMIHVVGQWPTSASHIRAQLPEHVIEIIEDKVDELEDVKSKIESTLFRLTLTTPRGERVTPTNGYFDWTVVSLFRQWLAENTTPPPPPVHKDSRGIVESGSVAPLPPTPPTFNTGRVYRLLGAGGSAYLPHDEIKRFVRLQPEATNRDTVKRFERRMDELKMLARQVTRPLMRNRLELEVGKDFGGLGYLSCTSIEERDFPWVAEE
ncbi:MAG: hypothetical protein M4579_004035 [Chaenotheca gracillima]|nr:MAG: hypothetical protein M4579_004035 [Chaenotheca gracillima]